jgi:hypothetical protein
MICVFGMVIGRAICLRIKLPLSLQLDTMRLSRFDAWFEEQLRFMFGRFETENGRIRWGRTIRREKAFYLGLAAFVLIVTASAFFLSGANRVDPWLWPKRVVDYGLFYLVVFLGFRYVVGSTLFVYQYSRLSLKPMLTRINDDGLRAFGSLFTANIIMVSVLYCMYWTLASLVVKMDFYGDFFFLGVASLIMGVWTIGMPFMIRLATREAKSKSVHVYSAHLEQAFKSFLEEPDEERSERYAWLVKKQDIIRKIPTWPLNWKETLFVLAGGNLLALTVDAWYVIYRLGKWPEVVAFLKNLG